MKINELRKLVRAAIKEALAENKPAVAPTQPSTKPTVAPGKPGTKPQKPRRPLGNPEVKPNPKAEGLNEEEMLKKIVARFKSKK